MTRKNCQTQALTLALLAGMAALCACADPFTPYSLLEGLRVLAIRAKPSSIAPQGTTTLEALVHNPEGKALSYAWSWCAERNTSGQYDCDLTEADLNKRIAEAAAASTPAVTLTSSAPVSYGLGNAEQASFAYFAQPELKTLVCQAIHSGDSRRASGSGQSSTQQDRQTETCSTDLTLSIELDVSAGTEQIRALKTITLLSKAGEANADPALDGLRLGEVGAADSAMTALGESGGSLTVKAGATYQLTADIPESAAEQFTVQTSGQGSQGSTGGQSGTGGQTTSTGGQTSTGGYSGTGGQASTGGQTSTGGQSQTRTSREMLTLSWFVTAGTLATQLTTLPPRATDFSALRTNRWTLPQSLGSTQSQVWIYLVLRDSRGGMSWIRRSVTFAP